METGDNTFVGELSEVRQDDDINTFDIPNLPVEVVGPVQVHQLPSISAGSRKFVAVASTEARRVANADPRRRSITVLSIAENFYVGATQNEAQSGYGAEWPKLVPLVMTHQDAVYVTAVQNTTTVSVLVENWAS